MGNLTLNPGLESVVGNNFANWTEGHPGTGTVSEEGTVVHGGLHSAKLTGHNENNFGRIQQLDIPLVIGVTYRISFWVKGSFSLGMWIGPAWDDPRQGEAVNGVVGDWTQVIRYYEAEWTKFAWWALNHIYLGGGAVTAYYDDFRVISLAGSSSGAMILGGDF